MSLFYFNHRQGVAGNFLFSIQYKSVLTDLSELFILWLILFQHFSGHFLADFVFLFFTYFIIRQETEFVTELMDCIYNMLHVYLF